MIYTLNDLERLISLPVNATKWGQDTYRLISLVRRVLHASCTSCAERRYIKEINDILVKHGDSIKSHLRAKNTATRNTCIDCTIKHLSQAFVLQGEFYQGYTEYLSLIESHISEANDECPIDKPELKVAIQRVSRKLAIDKEPEIPIIMLLDQDTRSVIDIPNSNIDIELPYLDINNISNKLSDDTKNRVIRLLSSIPAYTRYDDILARAEWTGRLACCSELCALEYPDLSRYLRLRRLKYYTNPINDEYIMKCQDILEALHG